MYGVVITACTHVHKYMHTHTHVHTYHIAGNFRGRKLSRLSRFESHPRKFCPWNFGHAAPTYVWLQAICESFLCEILTYYGSTKVFSLESLPLYDIIVRNIITCTYSGPWTAEWHALSTFYMNVRMMSLTRTGNDTSKGRKNNALCLPGSVMLSAVLLFVWSGLSTG